MDFLRCFSFISIASVILATDAGPGDLFLSDPLELIQHDPLADDFWGSNELTSVPDLALSALAQDTIVGSDDTNLSNEFSNDIFGTDPSDLIISSSACNTEGSLTNDFLQARDVGSCSTAGGNQQDINLPNLFDENFLPQGLGTSSVEQLEESSQGSIGKQPGDPGWAAYGLTIPEALRLQEDPDLCRRDIFGVSITPVCHNPVTGRVEYETANLYATLFNIIPCMPLFSSHNLHYFTIFKLIDHFFAPDNAICPPQEVWCCSIIRARVREVLLRYVSTVQFNQV